MKDLVSEIKKYFMIFLYFQKINIMKVMAYPSSFFISCIAVVLTMTLSILFINVNFSFVNSVSGWTYYQILGVVGSYMIVEGLMWLLFAQLNAINTHISEGTMDGVLLKPIDSQFLISIWRGDMEDVVRIIIGSVLIFISIINTTGFNVWHFILFLFLIINGTIMFYSLTIMIRAVSFWVIDGSGFWLLIERVSANSQYPVDIYYNKAVRGFFTFAVPLAFVATVPARILTNKELDWQLISLSFLMTLIFFFCSRYFWSFALNRYSSASS
ncbi:MAG: hypothetical protein ACD_9C00047G0006 [uncultured bacterium]|nr:MAG: hypothetical protein ACD_9C00047G0006 [uncultured bacterium]